VRRKDGRIKAEEGEKAHGNAPLFSALFLTLGFLFVVKPFSFQV
jgi:hypothetical protein